MKRSYQKPAIRRIDFEYEEQVVALSEMGVQARPTHPTDCQYSSNRVPACNQIYNPDDGTCAMSPWSLRPFA